MVIELPGKKESHVFVLSLHSCAILWRYSLSQDEEKCQYSPRDMMEATLRQLDLMANMVYVGLS